MTGQLLTSLLPRLNKQSGEGTRVFIGGAAGTGKTQLSYCILHSLRHNDGAKSIVIFDPKGTYKYPGLIVNTPEQIQQNQTEEVLIYRPGIDNTAKQDLDNYQRILRWILLRGMRGVPTVWYCDEGYAMAPDGVTYPEALRTLYTRGREFGITPILVAQRPVSIPRVTYTEGEWFYCFRLLAKSDRERMSETMGPKVMAPAEDHNFWYCNILTGEPTRYACLNLK